MCIRTLVLNYSSFNEWANDKIVNWLAQFPLELLYESVPSSFSSIDFTLQHILRTQRFWLSFINEQDTSGINWSVRSNEAVKIMNEMSRSFSAFSEEELEKKLHLDMPWAKNSLQRFEYIVHIVNHGTFHRGQIITMARSLGMTNGVVNTDYNMFHIEKDFKSPM
jgi:uncharacterized damage-inducible protein DinB